MAQEKNNSKKNLFVGVVLALIVAAGAFYAGVLYQKSQTRNTFGQFAREGRFGQGQIGMMRGGANNRGFGGAVIGDIVSIDNDSLTVKLSDGSSKIVNLSSATTYSKTETGAKTDLKAGTKIAAIGTANSDGSVTAQNIQINPAFRMLGRPTQQK